MKLLITGSGGLVGSELMKMRPEAIGITRQKCDLTSKKEVVDMFREYQPDVVVHLAAKVGGILDNIENPATYFDENVLMNTNMLVQSRCYGVKRFVGILSTCAYPDVVSKYPMIEGDLHLGPPAGTNFAYGYTKRMMAVQIDAYNRQYGTRYNYLIPCNLYGDGDKSGETKSHFVTALLHKIRRASISGEDHILLMGDGTPLRQFMHARDLATIIHLSLKRGICENFNVASPENLSIDGIARMALKVTGNGHMEIRYDRSKPNGQYRKDVDCSKLKELFPEHECIRLEDGIKRVYNSISSQTLEGV